MNAQALKLNHVALQPRPNVPVPGFPSAGSGASARKGGWQFAALFMLALALVLSGCQSMPGGARAGTPKGAEILQTRNAVGEDCRVLDIDDEVTKGVSAKSYKVFCGRWEHPSARIYKVPGADAGRPLSKWAEEGWWLDLVNERALCDPPQTGMLSGGEPALTLDCRLHHGGWPYVAMVASSRGDVYLADGIPAAFGVIEDAIGVISGTRKMGAGESGKTVTSAVRLLEARLSERMYGAGDLQTYYDAMTLGQYYNGLKDFPASETKYREALAIHERLLGAGNPESLDALMHIALALSNQARFIEASALFKRAEPMAQAKKSIDLPVYARFLSYLSLHAANQRQFDRALELARQATALRRAESERPAGSSEHGASAGVLVSENVDPDVVQSLYIEAEMLRHLGNPAQAQKVLSEAGDILQTAQEAPPLWEPQLINAAAKVAASRQATGDMQRQLSSAVTLWEQRAPGERPSALTYLALGEAYRAQGRTDDALAAFQKGIKLLKSRGDSVRFEQLQPYFQTALAYSAAHPDDMQALHVEMFEAAQLVRSARTAQDIALAAARLGAGKAAASAVVRQLQDAEQQRYQLYRAYESEVAGLEGPAMHERLQGLQQDIVAVNRRVSELSEQVQAAFPGYNQVIDTIVDAPKLLGLLKPDEAILQVLLGPDESMLFMGREGRIEAYRIPLTEARAADLVKRLRAGIELGPDGQLPAFDVGAANQLYQQLFAPVAQEIEQVKHIVWVPSGPLLSLPLGVLVTEPPSPGGKPDYRQVSWLVKRYAVSLVPSVRSFVDLRAVAKASHASHAFVGFGDFVPISAAAASKVQANIARDCLHDSARLEEFRELLAELPALPATAKEVSAISRTFPPQDTQVVMGADFTKARVRTLPLQDYRILYFATHALLPAELECQPQPALVTSLEAAPKQGADPLLDTEEIMQLKLDADAVVLSACNTGGPGNQTGGESLSGLARAFFFAGARALVVSHWSVEDESTGDLMIRMFQHMRSTPPADWATALQAAQISVIEDAAQPRWSFRSHPLFWGAFSLVGDGSRHLSEPTSLQARR